MAQSFATRMATALVLLGVLTLGPTPAPSFAVELKPAQAGLPVDVALVIAVDISLSMDPGEQALQRLGYVEAFRHPDLLATIGRGLFQRIAVAYVEWGSSSDQSIVLPWTVVEDRASAERVAAELEKVSINRSRSTSISTALDVAVALFSATNVEPLRRVIDVSGDGPNNDGRAVLDARADAVAQGVTINGLPVMLRPMGFSPWSIPDLDAYYTDCVIGGPGAFVLPVRDPADLKNAIRQKLLLEIAGRPAESRPAGVVPAQVSPSGADCLIGERLRRQIWPD